MKKFIITLLFCFMIGCDGIPTSGPLVNTEMYWAQNEAHKYYHTDSKSVRMALLDVLRNDLEFSINEERVRDNKTFIESGDGDRFHITIKSVRDNVTRLSCRLNYWNDNEIAERMYELLDNKKTIKSFKDSEELNSAIGEVEEGIEAPER